jgi:uncharacterized protein (TIGR03067 family)
MFSSVVALWIGVSLLQVAANDRGDKQPKKSLTSLQGAWKLVSVEAGGEARDLAGQQPRWLIKDNKVLYGGEELAVLTVDASTTPKSIDLAFVTPKRTYEGIYTIDGDTFKICVNAMTEGAKERPPEFSTKGKSNLRMLVFDRDKEVKGNADEGVSGFVGIMIRFDMERSQVVIADLVGESPAKKAGLKKDDVLIKVAGSDATDLRTVVNTIRQTKPGSEVAFRVRRDGKEKDITVKAGVMPFFYVD